MTLFFLAWTLLCLTSAAVMAELMEYAPVSEVDL